MTTEITEVPYIGARDESFISLITHVLKSSGLKTKFINILLSPRAIKQFGIAFTSSKVDPDNNYEMYELLGDVAAGHFIKGYMKRRFPVLNCAKGVKVVARLLINYGSKQSFSKIAEDLNFWPFISALQEDRDRLKKSLLEDVFEAFLGVVEDILDDEYKTIGVGYNNVYTILKAVFDKMEISLKYDNLYDAKTRLKEIFDKYRLCENSLGNLVYEEDERMEGDKITTSHVYMVHGGVKIKKQLIGGTRIKMGDGTAALKSAAQQKASSEAIHFLRERGYTKDPPAEYTMFDC